MRRHMLIAFNDKRRNREAGHGRRMNLALVSVLVFVGFLLVALLMTWPLALHPTSETLFLSNWGDNIGVMTTFWYSNYLVTHGLGASRVNPLLGYPFGTDAKALASFPLSNGVVRQLTNVFGFVAAYNIFLVLSFPLAGLVMFLLLFYITRRYSAAIVGGFAFAFTSWHLVRAAEHLSLVAIYVIPLFLLALLYFWRKRDVVSGALLVAAWTLALLTDFHFGYFCLVIAAVWVVVMFVMDYRKTNTFKPIDRRLVVMGLVLIIVAASLGFATSRLIRYKTASQFGEFNPRGGLVDVELNSSHPWNYIIPSYYNPLLGRLARGYSLTHLGPLTFIESAAYLGILPVILAIYAIWAIRRKRLAALDDHGVPEGSTDAPDENRGEAGPSGKEDVTGVAGYRPYVIFGLSMSVTAFVLSLSPQWDLFGRKIPWISWIQRWLIPPLRGYSRWAVVVLFGVTLLAGLGWAALTARRRFSTRVLVVLTIVVILLIGVDYAVAPPSRARELPAVPAVLEQMRKTPKGAPLVIYPLTNPNDFTLYQYEYFQSFHQHPMLNGTTRATDEDLYRMSVIGYNSAYTPRILRTLGIRYAAFLSGDFKKDVRFDPARLPPGYAPYYRSGADYLYSVDAAPAPVIPLYFSGFLAPALFPDGRAYAPVTSRVATMKLDVRKQGSYVVSMLVFSPDRPRGFTFLVDGKEIGAVTVPTGPVRLLLPTASLTRGKHDLVVKTSANPSSVDGTQFNTGDRIAAYMITGDFSVDSAP